MTAHTITREQLRELCDDFGSTYGAPNRLELADGVELRLRFEPDCESIGDLSDHGDVYGRTEWSRDNDYGPVRPSDFTGRAEILFRDHRSSLWWEPFDPMDIPGFREQGTRAQGFRDYRQNVRDIMEYGFYSLGLELCEGSDAYGRPIVTDVAWLGGIEPIPDDAYIYSCAVDLLAELESVELAPELECENGAEQ